MGENGKTRFSFSVAAQENGSFSLGEKVRMRVFQQSLRPEGE